MEPLVSVCMSVYNTSCYLHECIDSVLCQSFSDFELLIVDDGSTDNSCEIVCSYNDPRIRLIENNHDYIGSLNLLLKEARGKYIAKMDSDDVMRQNRLQVQYEYMESHSEISILASSAVYIDTKEPLCEYSDCTIVTKQKLLCYNPIIHPTTFMRTSILRNFNLKYEEDYKYAEDYRLWTECVKYHLKIAIIPFVSIEYRRNENQITQKYSKLVQKNADRVKDSFAEWLCLHSNKSYKRPYIKESNKLLTVIIPFLNEGIEVVETVKSLRSMVHDGVDIIIVNDCSTDELDYQSILSSYDVYYVLNKKRKGVAASRDLGIDLCKTPYFLLLDAHMRVYDGSWLKDITNLLDENDRQLLCAQTKQLWKDDTGKIIELKDVSPVYGAYATFEKGQLSPGIEWNYLERNTSENTQPIACVLGAGYAASKRYWTHLRGLEGLKLYGCDEVYISLKVWSEGGQCLLLKEHSFGHIYRNKAPYQVAQCSFIYNYLIVAYILFPTVIWCWILSCCQIARPSDFNDAWYLFKKNKQKLLKLKNHHSQIATVLPQKVIKMNLLMAEQCIDKADRINVANEIFPNVIEKNSGNYGIIDGKMAALIWMSLWDQEETKGTEQLRHELFDELKQAILLHKMPYNFRNGLCGVGWGLLYMYANNLIDDIDDSLLNQIDLDIQAIDMSKISNKSLYYGTSGILAYFVCRKLYNKHKGISSNYSSHFVSAITKESKMLLKSSNEHIAIYYSHLLKNINDIELINDFTPQLCDWVNFPITNPSNPRYWTYSMDNGCLGYTIPAFKIKEPQN